MSAADLATSLPPWKLALMERKRQGGGGGVGVGVASPPKTEEFAAPDTVGVPSWKRDILLKKTQQKNSVMFAGRIPNNEMPEASVNDMTHVNKMVNRRSYIPNYNNPVIDGHDLNLLPLNQRSSSESSICSDKLSVHVPPIEERILPIKKNPILLLDLEKRQHGFSSSGSTAHSPSAGHPPVKSDLYATDEVSEFLKVDGDADEVFGDGSENMTYGKGFVNRLLKRFSGLSNKDEHAGDLYPPVRSPKRSFSSGDMMHDNAHAPVYRYPDGQSKKVFPEITRSYDDLLQETSQPPMLKVNNEYAGSMPNVLSDNVSMPNGRGVTAVHSSDLIVDDSDHPQVNIVSNVRNIFESFKGSSPPQKSVVQISRPTSSAPETKDTKTLQSDTPMVQNSQSKESINNSNVGLSADKQNGFQVPSSSSDYKKDINENETHLVFNDNVQRSSNSRTFSSGVKSVAPPVKSPIFSSIGIGSSASVASSATINGNNNESVASNVGIGNDLNNSSDATSNNSIMQRASAYRVEDTPKVTSTAPFVEAPNKASYSAPRGDVSKKAASTYEQTETVKQWPTVQTKPNVSAKPTVIKSPIEDTAVLNSNVSVENRTNGATGNIARVQPQRATPPDKSDSSKRPAPLRPGMLLIRPASNLIASKTKTEYLELTKYNDVKNGEFAPATRRFVNENAVNNDDNVDGDDDDGLSSGAGREVFEFTGAAVSLGRSLLAKTKRHTKLAIQFDDEATKKFEYPSEQSLMDASPALPGYCDYISNEEAVAVNGNHHDDHYGGADDIEPTSLKSTPGLASNTGGALASYKSRMQVDYQFGQYDNEPAPVSKPVVTQQKPTQPEPSPQTEASSWGDTSSSSDLLF